MAEYSSNGGRHAIIFTKFLDNIVKILLAAIWGLAELW